MQLRAVIACFTILLCSVSPVWAFNQNGLELFPKGQTLYGVGDTLYVVISFSSPVPAECTTGQLTSNAGIFNLTSSQAFQELASYQGGDGEEGEEAVVTSSQRVFSHTVAPRENASPLKITSISLPNCPGYSREDGAFDMGVTISTTGPSLLSVSARVAPGVNFTMGGSLLLFVQFSRPVDVQTGTGSPILQLNTFGTASFQGFSSPTTFNILLFRYQIGAGEGAEALDVRSVNLNGSAIIDRANQLDADLGCPAPGKLGSLSHSTKIKIIAAGQKFPPPGYDGQRVPSQPTEVQVEVQLDSLSEVTEKTLSFKAEVTMVQSWVDPRFASPTLAPQTEVEARVLELIWTPKLTLANSRDKPAPFDMKAVVYNNGTVQHISRYIQVFYCPLDVTKFPFDVQSLVFSLRSQYRTSDVVLVPAAEDSPVAKRQTEQVENVENPSFRFFSYAQEVTTLQTGIYSGYQQLNTRVGAARISSFNSINILFPLSLLCFMVCVSFNLPLKSDGRVSMCNTALGGTLSFSFVLSIYTPPVNYITAMGLFICMTYVVGLTGVCCQIFIRYIMSRIDELTNIEKETRQKVKTRKMFGKGGVWVPPDKEKEGKGDKEGKAEKPDKAGAIGVGYATPQAKLENGFEMAPMNPSAAAAAATLDGHPPDGETTPLFSQGPLPSFKASGDDKEKKKLTDEEKMNHPEAVVFKTICLPMFGGLFWLRPDDKLMWVERLSKFNNCCRVGFVVGVSIMIGAVVGSAKS
mmetsp:Transcript_2735/g.6606  ORF Transcript_2735/g.6606 Transcript_2735/m.6606 type:complete len:749 (+) Transcript_2735:46-2292(+)